MISYRRALTGALALAAIACGLVACSAGATETTDSSNEALTCRTGVTCPKPTPPPAPHVFQTCANIGYFCDSPGANPAGVYDPVMILGASGYVADTSFTDMLTTGECGVEQYFMTEGGWWWATAVCPSQVSGEVDAYGAANGETAGVVPCSQCTQDPLVTQVVVAWLITPGTGQWCGDGGLPDGEAPRCTQPGPGCKTVGCLTD